ncbi:hypothetical protein,putative calcium-binding protein, partial [Xenococcus sp. PCC 7305]|uniref:CRTAC homolog protein n=1 Tax=Xenococcus sp. PCC 7305 TaxID=102125 RepID=UPI0002ACC4EF
MFIFDEVTQNAGISNVRSGESSFWGDFNNDGWPDLLTGWHLSPTVLYQNNKDGTFTNVTSVVFSPSQQPKDNHGAAWVDFDNDGDQDLVELVGSVRGTGLGDNNLYINNDGILSDKARELGIDYSLGRGRTPTWFDLDKDGLLDLVMAVAARADGQAPPTIFRQTNSGFEDIGSTIGFNPNHNVAFGLLSDLSGDGNLDLIVIGEGARQTVYDISSLPFRDITNTVLPNNSPSRDIAIADFNNDLRPDIYSTLSWNLSDFGQEGANDVAAWLGFNQDEQGIKFDTNGDVKFNLYIPKQFSPIPGLLSQSEVYIGAGGLKAIDEDPSTPNNLEFTLSPTNPNFHGIFSHQAGSDRGVYIGYNPTLENWQLLLSTPNRNSVPISIESTEPISELEAIGFNPNQPPPLDKLLLNNGSQLVDYTGASAINRVPNAGVSVATGDFDNDMDIDLYIVATSAAINQPNILYANQGDGTFIPVTDAGGAAGTTRGVGSRVTTVDYDQDGFLDLFVTNHSELIEDAPYELFRNLGNDNHWLEIDLEGVVSNRDGIGAQIFATAGGVTQLREQAGGIHNGAQNHQRIHFGLADNNIVDELIIRWPSGIEQTLTNISADQIIQIVESTDSEDVNDDDQIFGQDDDDLIVGGDGNDTLNGGSGNDQVFGQNDDDLIVGGDGNDTLGGGTGNDQVFGQNDDDLIVGGDGNDTLNGGSGNDQVFGQDDDDVILGEAGNDALDGGNGDDQIFGQDDDDSIFGGDGNDTLGGGTGNDQVFGQNDDDLIVGEAGNDTLNGGSGNDQVFGQ